MSSDDELSDLTDLESEDEEYEGPKRKAGDRTKSGYKIRNALKVPRATTYTAQALFSQMHDSEIDLEAEYQRDIVWTETKQVGLIDSIFRNFYIPPIIFAVKSYDDGSERKICIDGKQRLTAISLFMNGQIPHRDPFTNEKLWYREPRDERAKKSYRLLPVKYQKIFANKQIVCVEYQEITDSDEREIFQRVQLGVALTPAEKLMVIKTDRADFIRELQNVHMKEEGGLSAGSLDWNTARGGDYRGLSFAVYCMEKFDPEIKLPGMPQIERWLTVGAEFSAEFKDQVRDAYRIFSDIAQHEKYSRIFQGQAKISPIEFVFIGVMIYVHKDKASLAQLANGIEKMREHVRSTHVDIRLNLRVMKTATDFIVNWKPPKVAGDPGGVAAGIITGPPLKRKRPVKKDDDDCDDSMDGDYPANKKKTAKTSSKSSKASSSSTTLPPSEPKKVKTERPPPVARINQELSRQMAELKKAQEKLQASRASASRSANTPTRPQEPQMLPSPGQTFIFPSRTANSTSASSHSASTSQLPPPPSSSTLASTTPQLDQSLMATMLRASASSSRAAQLPTANQSGPSNARQEPSRRDSNGSFAGRR